MREEVREDRLHLAGELRSFHDSLLQNEAQEMQNAERHMAQQAELAHAQRHVAQKAELVQQEYLQMQEQARNMSQLESQAFEELREQTLQAQAKEHMLRNEAVAAQQRMAQFSAGLKIAEFEARQMASSEVQIAGQELSQLRAEVRAAQSQQVAGEAILQTEAFVARQSEQAVVQSAREELAHLEAEVRQARETSQRATGEAALEAEALVSQRAREVQAELIKAERSFPARPESRVVEETSLNPQGFASQASNSQRAAGSHTPKVFRVLLLLLCCFSLLLPLPFLPTRLRRD